MLMNMVRKVVMKSTVIEAGLNYGWPTITYGRNYGIGTAIGEGVEKRARTTTHLLEPSIAPRA